MRRWAAKTVTARSDQIGRCSAWHVPASAQSRSMRDNAPHWARALAGRYLVTLRWRPTLAPINARRKLNGGIYSGWPHRPACLYRPPSYDTSDGADKPATIVVGRRRSALADSGAAWRPRPGRGRGRAGGRPRPVPQTRSGRDAGRRHGSASTQCAQASAGAATAIETSLRVYKRTVLSEPTGSIEAAGDVKRRGCLLNLARNWPIFVNSAVIMIV